MTEDLAARHCEPCHAGTPRVPGHRIQDLLHQLHDRWTVVDGHHLEARLSVPDFASALDLANRVGRLADSEGHHPEVCVTWGRAVLRIWTHAIDGLSGNDFILAARIDRLLEDPSGGTSAGP